jgi:hypothetical protein
MHDVRPFQSQIIAGVGELDEVAWTTCYPDHAEGWQYYSACECGAVEGMRTAAIVLRDVEGFVAAAPLFEVSYRLDTSVQSGVIRRISDFVARHFPKLMVEWRLLGVGSPYADQCHIAFRPGLTRTHRDAAFAALIGEVEAEAKRRRASLIAYKDLLADEYNLAQVPISHARYVKIASLPMAVLEINATDIDGYLARLSPSTRKDIRRKLKAARGAVTIERRSDISDIAGIIEELYESTRQSSAVSYDAFEELPQGYFRTVSERLKDGVIFILYWVNGELAAFNMLLLEPGRVIDKFLGMRYPLARDHNLYAVSWMENVRYCLETGRRQLQTGQTAYAAKLRYGSHLVPSALYVKHQNRAVNRVIRWVAPLIAFDRWDPDLRKIARDGRKPAPAREAHSPAGACPGMLRR